MDEERIIQELMHFMKAENEGLKRFFNDMIKYNKKWCPFTHGKLTDISCYLLNPNISYLNLVLDKYCLCFEFLGIDSFNLKRMNEIRMKLENHEFNRTYKEFQGNLNEIKEIIDCYSSKVNEKLQKLTCQECIRLDEAINCFKNFQFYASVVMAVSSVEARLHYLVKNKNNKLYKEYFEKATIGQLIKLFDEKEYMDNKFKNLKKLLPKKFKPLIELLNYLRVYSAHPKSKKITFKLAQSALNLSFDFLLDDETKIKEKKLRECIN